MNIGIDRHAQQVGKERWDSAERGGMIVFDNLPEVFDHPRIAVPRWTEQNNRGADAQRNQPCHMDRVHMKERKPTEKDIFWTSIRHLCDGPGIEDFVGMGVPGQFRRPGCAACSKIGCNVA